MTMEKTSTDVSADHQPPYTGDVRHGFWRGATTVLISGALVLSTTPMVALADTGSTATQQTAPDSGGTPPSDAGGSQGGTAPSGAGDSQGGTPPSMPGGTGSGGANVMTFDYTGTYSGAITADSSETAASGKSYDASEADLNAALAQNDGTLDLSNVTLTKSGDDTNGDNCNFYGLNSILTAVGSGSMAYVSSSTLSATSEGSNGIFATDDATVYAKDTSISTTAGNSRGLDATYGGTIVADGMTIDTRGDHCAGVATDRGGGSVSLTNSTLSTAGSGSPLLYSTGDIEVSNVTGTASGSQLCGMEGLNTILVNDSTLTSTQTDKTASDPIADGIIIYQSTSGDAESTTGEAASFQAANSTLSSAITSGSMFYFTNTSANVVLSNTTLDFDSSAANLIEAAGNDSNSWGTAGSNGATVTFTGLGETMQGDVDVDTISSVDLYLLEDSTWTGAASVSDNEAGADTSETPLTVNVGAGSTWEVTSDSTVSSLNVAEGGNVVDADGKTVSVIVDGETVVAGDGDVTVTASSYSTDVSGDGAGSLSTSLIDRTAYDSHYSTQTSFTMGSGSASTTEATTTSESDGGTTTTTTSWWDSVVSWFASLFGL